MENKYFANCHRWEFMKTKKDLPVDEQITAIIQEFSLKDLVMLFDEVTELIRIHENDHLIWDEIYESNLDLKNVIEPRKIYTALTLHKLAINFAKKFKKIANDFPNFDTICNDVAEEVAKTKG
jgi:hypothetical protein